MGLPIEGAEGLRGAWGRLRAWRCLTGPRGRAPLRDCGGGHLTARPCVPLHGSSGVTKNKTPKRGVGVKYCVPGTSPGTKWAGTVLSKLCATQFPGKDRSVGQTLCFSGVSARLLPKAELAKRRFGHTRAGNCFHPLSRLDRLTHPGRYPLALFFARRTRFSFFSSLQLLGRIMSFKELGHEPSEQLLVALGAVRRRMRFPGGTDP